MNFVKRFNIIPAARTFCHRRVQDCVILGIETSCDDTGCGIVRSDRHILGQCLISQQEETLRHGGIIPNLARDLHKANIHNAVTLALDDAKITFDQIDAVAVAVKPGLIMSLFVGLNYAKEICQKYKKPLVPIHHMQAHALVSRLINKDIEFPFLTFLISGGHCLIAVVESVDKFTLLGHGLDDAPGEALDKVARRLKLHNLPQYRSLSGGAAVEEAAKTGNPFAFDITQPLLQYLNCNFSFSGLKSNIMKIINAEEKKYDIIGDDVLPNVGDICASFQHAIAKHLCARLQRATDYVQLKSLLPNENRFLVVSGGAACNSYFRRAFDIICREKGYTLFAPPPAYCTDNGIMIAWNGIERYQTNCEIHQFDALDEVTPDPQCDLGVDCSKEVHNAAIKCKWIDLQELVAKSEEPVARSEEPVDESEEPSSQRFSSNS